MTHDEKIVEAVARAIYEAPLEISGDTVAEIIHCCEWISGAQPLADQLEQVRDVCRELARAAITAFQAEAWQPIETAPKHGDELLATNASLHGGFPQVVYWEDGRWHVPDAGISYHPDAFTHWRRDILPPAPKATP